MSGMELLQGSQEVESDSVFCLCCLGASHLCENAQNSQVMEERIHFSERRSKGPNLEVGSLWHPVFYGDLSIVALHG